VAEGKVTAKAPDDSAAAKLTVTYGEDLIDLDAQLSAREQCGAFDLEAWDPKAVETVSAKESAESGAKLGDLSASKLAEVGGKAADATALSAAVSQSMLQTAAKARRDRAALARMRARLTYQGSAKAGLGDVVELARVGDRFGGKGVVTAVGHRIENGQWLTEAAFGLPRPWRAETPEGLAAPAAGAMTAPVAGLQIGTVVKLSDDPDGLHRLTVSLPTVAGDSQVLARYAAPYASGDAGLMLLPEIGDEVVVGFLDDDPGQAVVLGSLHNGKNAQPEAVSDDKNNVKILRSREDLRLTFDEEKKSITLSTPGGATVTLSDEDSSITAEDQSGNTLSMTKAGVTLDSKAALTLKAAQAVTISAGAAVTVSGANVEITGDMSAKMSGNASAELSSAGQTKVAGSLVNIN
jgi:uncharacterized protein involved in type VI secretion and phage assembly